MKKAKRKIMKIQNKEKQQYFELKEIEKFELEKYGSIVYRKLKQKIGVVYQQTQFFDIHYYEKEKLKYYKRVQFIWKNYWDNQVNSEYVRVCFCGELNYFFFFPYQSNLIKICLQTGEETEYKFEDSYPFFIEEVKNSNLIIVQRNLGQEIRDAQSFTVLMRISNQDCSKIYLSIKNFFNVKSPNQFFEKQLKNQNNIQMFNLNLNNFFPSLIVLENNVIIQNFRLRCLQLKSKIIRKILRSYEYQTEILSVRMKKYHNQCYLKLKAQNFVSFSEYDWVKGELQFSENLKQHFNGFLTFREGSTSYYLLKYIPVNHGQNDKIVTIQKFDLQYTVFDQ